MKSKDKENKSENKPNQTIASMSEGKVRTSKTKQKQTKPNNSNRAPES